MTNLLRSLSLSCLLAAATLLSPAASAQKVVPVPSRITARVDNAQRTPLPGSVHRFATAANDRGVLPDSTPLQRVQVVLKRSPEQEAVLQQRIQQLHQPGSPNYHQWLTPESFGAEFGPSDADVAAISTWLSSQGLTVTRLNPGKQTLEFEGTAGQFRAAFHAELHKFAAPDGSLHNSVATDPDVPTALAPVFGGFVSLNNFTPKPPHSIRGKGTMNPVTHEGHATWTEGTGGVEYYLAPGDFATQYDLTPLYTAGTKGDGQTIAVINISNVNTYFVNQFRSLFSLPASPLQVIIDGQDPGVDGVNNPSGHNGWAAEAYLDVEWAGVAAPNAKVDLVIAGDTALSDGFSLAAEHAVYNNIAPIMSLSVEECESGNGASYNAFLSSLWQQAAAQGITVLVASSDSGSAGCDNFDTEQYATGGQAVNGWSSTPYNVSVGGTDFYYSGGSSQLSTYWNTTASNTTPTVSIKSVIPEQPWNDTQYGLNLVKVQTGETNIIAGSGGPSNCATGSGSTCKPYAKPAWQTGTGVPADGARDLPDLAIFAANGYNDSSYPTCMEDGDCQPATAGGDIQISGAGGTSASTPAFAGIMALITQTYGRQGQANYVFYPLATQYPAAFHDIAVGTNSVPCNVNATSDGYPAKNCIAVSSPLVGYDSNDNVVTEGELGSGSTVYYKAGTGYDMASGLGSVDAAVMVADWNKITFGATTTTLTPSSTTFAHGSSVTLSGAVTNSTSTKPTGTVAVMTSSTQVNNASETDFTLSAGAYSGALSTLPGGTYTLYSRYGGDTLNASSSSTPVTITVTPEASGTTLEALTGGATISSGGTVTYGATVSLDSISGPTSQLSALVSCFLTGASCPSVTAATGSAVFTDNGGAIGTSQYNAYGEAGLVVTPAIGSHSVTSTYSGDPSYNASSSNTVSFTVGKNTPRFAAATNDYFGSGGPTVLTLFVSNSKDTRGSAVAPTGTVTLSGLPASISKTATLTAGNDPSTGAAAGVANILLPAIATLTTYNVGMTYPGDTNYAAASGTVTAIEYPQNGYYSGTLATTTTATVTGSATPGAGASLSVTVTGTAGRSPSNYIFVYQNGNLINFYSLPSGGTAASVTHVFTLGTDYLESANNVLTIQYIGDNYYAASATTATVTATQSDFTLVPTTAALSALTGSSTALTDTVNLTSSNGFAGAVSLTCSAPAGVTCSLSPTSVTLPAGGIGSSTLSINTSAASAGNDTVVVTGVDATGQFAHTASVTVAVVSNPTFTLTPASTSLSVAAGATSATDGITLVSTGGFTGPVALTCSATGGMTCTYSSTPVTLTSGGTGASTLNINTAAVTSTGAYSVTVTGTSGTVIKTATVTVNVTISAVAPSITVTNGGNITIATQGGTGTTPITVTPSNGFTGSVTMSCAVTANTTANPTCSVTSPITITGSTSGGGTLTINTTAPTTGMVRREQTEWLAATGLGALLLLAFPARRRRYTRLVLAAAFTLLSLSAITGCGGGSSSSGGHTATGGTPIGSYNVSVTGADTATGKITSTTTLTVTVN